MRIGAMNHPANDVLSEIRWMADMGLEFLDLTIEPPAAASWRINPTDIRRELEQRGMGVVGHTAYYLPFANLSKASAGLRSKNCDAASICLRQSGPNG